jgi:hypothetical protein
MKLIVSGARAVTDPVLQLQNSYNFFSTAEKRLEYTRIILHRYPKPKDWPIQR